MDFTDVVLPASISMDNNRRHSVLQEPVCIRLKRIVAICTGSDGSLHQSSDLKFTPMTIAIITGTIISFGRTEKYAFALPLASLALLAVDHLKILVTHIPN